MSDARAFEDSDDVAESAHSMIPSMTRDWPATGVARALEATPCSDAVDAVCLRFHSGR